jgi:hypothetical protein
MTSVTPLGDGSKTGLGNAFVELAAAAVQIYNGSGGGE